MAGNIKRPVSTIANFNIYSEEKFQCTGICFEAEYISTVALLMWHMVNLFTQLHALILINKEAVCFHVNVFFQGQLFSDESFE